MTRLGATDGYLGNWTALEPSIPQPTLNRCPAMRRIWALLAIRPAGREL